MSATVIPSFFLRNSFNFGSFSARRNLFGSCDHEETLSICRKELSKIAESDRSRWNFDFNNGTPLSGGRYEWKCLTKSIPRYLTTPIPSSREITPTKVDRLSLQATIKRMSTATTTVVPSVKSTNIQADIVVKNNKLVSSNEESNNTKSKISSTQKVGSKQTYLTDFLKTRKRPHSATTSKDDVKEVGLVCNSSKRTKIDSSPPLDAINSTTRDIVPS